MKSGTERSRMRRFASLLPAFVLCVSAFGQGTSPQQINLLPIADQRYGVAPFQVIALASSYLPVTITATGPVTLDGRWLTVTGVGTVTVSAHQAGNISVCSRRRGRAVHHPSRAAGRPGASPRRSFMAPPLTRQSSMHLQRQFRPRTQPRMSPPSPRNLTPRRSPAAPRSAPLTTLHCFVMNPAQ